MRTPQTCGSAERNLCDACRCVPELAGRAPDLSLRRALQGRPDDVRQLSSPARSRRGRDQVLGILDSPDAVAASPCSPSRPMS